MPGYDDLTVFLDFSRPELESIDSEEALLAYFLKRTSVGHPVDNQAPMVSDEQMAIADDALRNTLLTCIHYPRHDFGSDIDWLANAEPSGDKEWLWQLHRHASWTALADAYHHTGDEKYAACYVNQLLDWIERVPLDEASALRCESPGWRTLEAGIRAHIWTFHFVQFIGSPSYTPQTLVTHLLSFHEHADFLCRTLNPENTHNWGLMRAEGLAFLSITFPEFKEAALWRRKAFAHLNAQINRQVRPDGHQLEQCLCYHAGAIDWFWRTAEMAELNGLAEEFPSTYKKRLEEMCDVLLKLSIPDGTSAQFGDTHTPVPCRMKLQKWADLFDRDDFRYFASNGINGTPSAQMAFALKDSGFYSMRSGWDEDAICLVLKCGPDGGGHCHPDNGTFEICAFGRRLTPDSGTYVYSGNTVAHDWFRQSWVDQTVTLDRRDIAFKPRLILWKPGQDMDVVVVENDSYPDFTHRRAILFVDKQFFVVIDDVFGKAEGDLRAHFRLAAGPCVIEESALYARTDSPDDANILVQGLPANGIVMVAEEGQVSVRYGVREPRPAFCFRTDKKASPVRFVTVFMPYQGGKPPEVRMAMPAETNPFGSRAEVDVSVNHREHRVGYSIDD